MGKTISDFIKSAEQSSIKELQDWAKRIHTDKMSDLERLGTLDLPQYALFNLAYTDFNKNNRDLTDFFNRCIFDNMKFVVRAIPTNEGKKHGYTRNPRIGLKDFEESDQFLKSVIKSGEENLWGVGITSISPQIYGGVIISGIKDDSGCRRFVYGELSEHLDKLTAGEEDPLASFLLDRGGLGHIENKTKWLLEKDLLAKQLLWKCFRTYIARGESFNPLIWEGYFEFVVTEKREFKFVDYKDNEEYLK